MKIPNYPIAYQLGLAKKRLVYLRLETLHATSLLYRDGISKNVN